MPNAQTKVDDCVKTCPTGYIASMADRKCYLLSTASTLGCVNMKISSDKKTCSYNCPYDEIFVSLPDNKGYCIA